MLRPLLISMFMLAIIPMTVAALMPAYDNYSPSMNVSLNRCWLRLLEI